MEMQHCTADCDKELNKACKVQRYRGGGTVVSALDDLKPGRDLSV